MSDTSIKDFISDLEQFCYGESLTVVDVGAHKGGVFQDIINSTLDIYEAHLFEPNPDSYAELEKMVEQVKNTGGKSRINTYNSALGDAEKLVVMKKADTMTKVVNIDEKKDKIVPENADKYFEIGCRTLDSFVDEYLSNKISLLKIDVEGYELETLEGAKNTLLNQAADVVYIEAGLNPEGTQQTYYRLIDDVLIKHGYRLFRIYEQKHEWIEDSPFLRRMNMAYFSESFASRHPYEATKKKYAQMVGLSDPEKTDSHSSQKDKNVLSPDTSVEDYKAVVSKQADHSFKRLESFYWLVNTLDIRGRLPHLEGREMAPDTLLAMHDYIRQERPRLVVLIGGEASAIVAADALRQNGIGNVIVFEHSKNFGNTTQQHLKKEYLSAWCELRVSPLIEWSGERPIEFQQSEGAMKNNKVIKWHDPDDFQDIESIDFLVVDGPYGSLCPYARYPALPALIDRLSPSAEIWLDDTYRSDEKAIANKWSEEYSLDLDFISSESGFAKLKHKAVGDEEKKNSAFPSLLSFL